MQAKSKIVYGRMPLTKNQNIINNVHVVEYEYSNTY